MKTPFFLTGDEHNLSVAQETLIEANNATVLRTDKIKDPLYDTPNHPNIRGYMRWVMVQKHFELAAQNKLKGISPVWITLGGVSVLELHGDHTIVTPCHLLKENGVPNETTYRRDLRIQNEVCPLLFPELNEGSHDSSDNRLRILLVHGGKDGVFAYLRAYTDPDDNSVYRNLSDNLMLMPTMLPSIDYEPVDEPEVGLNDAGQQKESGENQA
jgi:hypothetical protein